MVPHEWQEHVPLLITLEEGIPVRGRILYDNGTPATDRSLEFVQQVEPVLGAGISAVRNALRISRFSRTNDDGAFEIFLLPGEYAVRDGLWNQSQTLTIAETDTEKQLDWTMPTPIFVETERENGLPTGRIDYSFYTPENHRLYSSSSNDQGSFVLDPITENSVLYLSDMSKRYGIVETITPAMVGETTRFTLKPMGNASVTLVSADGNPAVGQRVSLSMQFYNPKDQSTNEFRIGSAVTDSEGKAVIPVSPGNIPVVLRLHEATYELPIPTGGRRMQSDIRKELNLSPGETFDFGTIQLREVF